MPISEDLFAGYWPFWLASGMVAGLLLVGVFGRGPVRFFQPLFRLIALPFRPIVFLLRRLGILPKAAVRARTARNALVNARLGAAAEIGAQSEIELALSLPDDEEIDDDEESAPQPYDYTDAKTYVKFDGVLFRSIAVRTGYLPEKLTSAMSDEIGDEYLTEARQFFNQRPHLRVNPNALYEDAEGAVAIMMFRKFDRRCYYVLNEMRKTINGNARRMMIIFSLILSATAAAVFAASIQEYYKIGACVIALIAMGLLHNAGYQKQQQHSIRELRSFLTRYLGRISDRFREVTGNARGVTVGDETDSQKLSERAMKWHKVMIWLPFRTFFIETFVRNLLYQIDRNSQYYLYIWVPAILLVAGVIVGAMQQGVFTVPTLAELVRCVSLGAFGVVVFAYFWLINKVVIAEELNQADWLGFDDLNVSSAMDEVVGKYAEDVGFWKGRFDR